jgi:hypothetical protein
MFSPSRRASDRTGSAFKHVRDQDACFSALDIYIKLDVFEKRGMDGATHHPIYPPMGCPLVGLATVEDGSKSVSLLAISRLVDDDLTFAIAFVDRPRPGIEEGCAEPIEGHVSKMALINVNGREAPTVSVRGAA